MQIRELVAKAHITAMQSGWHDKPRSDLEFMALIHSEISEAVEEIREGTPPIYQQSEGLIYSTEETPQWIEGAKPEGVGVELADAIIRIADYCGYRGIDLQKAIEMKMKYNETRPYRHGGKRY